MNGSRVRAGLGAAGLVTASVLAGLLLLEAGLRLRHYEPQRFRNTARVVDAKARAPKPGAKPVVNPKKKGARPANKPRS